MPARPTVADLGPGEGRFLLGQLDQAVLERVAGEACHAVNAQLPLDVPTVGVDGADADGQPTGDFGAAQPLAGHAEDLAFPGGELLRGQLRPPADLSFDTL